MAEHHLTYEYAVHSNSSATKVARLVGPYKRVLELGCGPGMITRLLAGQQCRVTVLEMDPQALEAVAQYCEAVHACDLNDPAWPAKLADAEQFEAIVAGDVLEHLTDPWTTVERLVPLLAEGGHVVISLPHAGHNALIASLIASDFAYQPWGLLDKTHIRFFGMHNIQELCERAGLKITEVDYVVKPPEYTEFARRWRQLPGATRLALSANPFGSVYQVVVKAVPKAAVGKGLKLVSLPVPDTALLSIGAHGDRLLRYLVSYLSLNTRQRIAHTLARLGLRR
jgi:2-polyprenyl-3-methyl-5-hydroxy-6-metoxy-1,4-benzoquinol methylase